MTMCSDDTVTVHCSGDNVNLDGVGGGDNSNTVATKLSLVNIFHLFSDDNMMTAI